MLNRELIDSLNPEELDLLIHICTKLRPSGNCEISQNTLVCFKEYILDKKLRKVRKKIDPEQKETFNSIVEKLGLGVKIKE